MLQKSGKNHPVIHETLYENNGRFCIWWSPDFWTINSSIPRMKDFLSTWIKGNSFIERQAPRFFGGKCFGMTPRTTWFLFLAASSKCGKLCQEKNFLHTVYIISVPRALGLAAQLHMETWRCKNNRLLGCWFAYKCMEQIKNVTPQWWFNGKLPWWKVKQSPTKQTKAL